MSKRPPSPCVGCGRIDCLWEYEEDPAVCIACYAAFALAFFDIDGEPSTIIVAEGPATRVADALLELVK